jgi:hypothetical protein
MGADFEMFAPFFSATGERIGRRQPAEVLRLLATHGAELENSMRGLSDKQLRWSPSAGEWCMKEIAGHMIDIAEIFIRRVLPVVDPTSPDADEPPVLPWRILDGKGYPDMGGDVLVSRFSGAIDEALSIVKRLADHDWRNRRRWIVGSVSVLDMASWLTNHNIAHLAQIRALAESAASGTGGDSTP